MTSLTNEQLIAVGQGIIYSVTISRLSEKGNTGRKIGLKRGTSVAN